jgi:hypothetical protein
MAGSRFLHIAFAGSLSFYQVLSASGPVDAAFEVCQCCEYVIERGGF